MSRIPSKSKLQATVEANAEKRQREFEKASLWSSTTQYYKNWNRHNNLYQTWTSPEYYTTSNQQYSTLQLAERKKRSLEERRTRLRKMLFDEEQQLETELTLSPRDSREKLLKAAPAARMSTETLKDINMGLKLVEEDRKRHEAEIKLYNQWRQNNPVIRDYESNQNRAGLKLAWLDQQIEKRMEKEKTEEEIKKMIAERDKAIQQQEEMEREEQEEISRKEKEMMQAIQVQIEEMKVKEKEASRLQEAEQVSQKKKQQLDEILERRKQDLQKRKQEEIALYNINQSKVKLRKKARDIEDQLKADQKLIEEIQAIRPNYEIECEAKKKELKRVMDQFLNYVREQRNLEAQRQKYISFIFDSEAKSLWEKQDRLWKSEQEARDKLFQQVLDGLREQVQLKINKNVEKQREVLQEREEMLHLIEENDLRMKQMQDELKEKKIQRRLELEKQIHNKQLDEQQKKMEEEKRRQEELENIKKEEDKIKQEILKLQKREYPIKQKYNRKIIW